MSRISYLALIGAMMGSGFAYSIVNGYGALHGLGMAAIYLAIGVAIALIIKAAQTLPALLG